MKLIIKLLLLTLFILTFNDFALGTGRLKGTITDSTSNNTLVGANVYIKGTALGASTNTEGEYIINEIPAGSYAVKVSYIGYTSKTYDVTIVDNITTLLDVPLAPEVLEGEEVVITAQASGQVSAINQQINSNTIVNVVSEEKIKELPDVNAAETIGRLPGVSVIRSGGEANRIILRGLDAKFVDVTVNGIKIPSTDSTSRGVDLSMISQNSLAGIELYKALTPDKDGDAVAGSVNLVTKLAPEKRAINLKLMGNYNNLMQSAGQYDFSLHYGERFFNNLLGLQLSGNLENRIRSNERINIDYALDAGFAGDYFIDDFLLEFTDETRKRNGFSLLLDLNTPDEGVIRFNNIYARTDRDFLWSTRTYPVFGGGTQQGDPVYNYRDREQQIKTINSSITGINHLVGLNLGWGFSFGQSDADFPYDYEMIFVEPGGMSTPPSQIRSDPAQLISYAKNDFSLTNLYWTYYRTQKNFDKERTAYLDIAKEFVFGDLLMAEIKGGGKYMVRDRSNLRSETFTPYYLGRWMNFERLPDGTFRQKDFTGTYFEDWWRSLGGASGGIISIDQFYSEYKTRDVYGQYLLNPLIDRDRLRQWQELNKYGTSASGSLEPSAQEVWINPLIKYDDYNITERVAAGYLMATLKIGQPLTLVGGARIENEDNDYISSYMPSPVGGFPVTANSIRDTSSHAGQTILLPNLNISFRPFEFMNLRIAAYKALSRPDFTMRLDRYIAGRPAEVGSQPQIYVGNPKLKTAEAWNFEINPTFFGNEFGLISLSAYYKEIKNMYHMLINFNTVAERDAQGVLQDPIMQYFGIQWKSQMGTTPYDLTLPYNSPEPTKVWGFEFEHQISFHFLPGLLKNIVLSYNASLIRSETIVYGSKTITYIDTTGPIPLPKYRNILVTSKQKLEGMPEFLGNVSLGYDVAGFSGRVSLFHKGKHNVSFSAGGFNDIETNAFTRIDIALKQRITDFLAVFVNIHNVTNVEDASTLIRRLYGYSLFDQSEQYGLTADVGVYVDF